MRRLNGGIQRQQVGLLGNALDDPKHLADFIALAVQGVDHLTGFFHRGRQPLNRCEVGLHQLAALARFLIRVCGIAGSGLRIARDLLHRNAHLVHGGGHHAGLVALGRGSLADLSTDRTHFLGRRRQLRGGVCKMADQRLLVLQHGIEGPRGIGHLITATGVST